MINNDCLWFSDWWGQVASLRGRPWTAALLLAPAGLKVGHFARELAAAQLCQRPQDSGQACGVCPACQWVAQGQHPDLRWVRPDVEREAEGEGIDADAPPAEDLDEASVGTVSSSSGSKASRDIRIEQIRGLLGFSQISSHRGSVRLALIGPIERLNFASANALLKGLEEPQSGMRFLLYGESLRGVPATILSRCRRIRLTASPDLVAAHRPGLSEVSAVMLPLMRQGRVDPLIWAGSAEKLSPSALIQFLVLWLSDLIRRAQGLDPIHFQQESAALDLMIRGLAGIGPERLQIMSLAQQRLSQRMRSADHPLNARLHVESILGEFSRAFGREWSHA